MDYQPWSADMERDFAQQQSRKELEKRDELVKALTDGYIEHTDTIATTDDIEMLRAICLQHSKWWEETAYPLLVRASKWTR